MRKTAHGDGSDRWANELEESVIDLEEQKHENEEKARERRARHQHEHEVREEVLHARQEALANAHKAERSSEAVRKIHETAAVVDKTGSWANQLQESVMDLEQEKHTFEEKARERHTRHALENQVREEVLHAQQTGSNAANAHVLRMGAIHVTTANQPVDKQQISDESADTDVVQSGARVGLFLAFALVLGVIIWWKKFVNSNAHSVHVPGIGKLNVVQSERMVMGFFNGVAPNSSLNVYGDYARASAPLKSGFAGPKAGYGAFTL